MAEFDPDKFLEEGEVVGAEGFDPDRFLSEEPKKKDDGESGFIGEGSGREQAEALLTEIEAEDREIEVPDLSRVPQKIETEKPIELLKNRAVEAADQAELDDFSEEELFQATVRLKYGDLEIFPENRVAKMHEDMAVVMNQDLPKEEEGKLLKDIATEQGFNYEGLDENGVPKISMRENDAKYWQEEYNKTYQDLMSELAANEKDPFVKDMFKKLGAGSGGVMMTPYYLLAATEKLTNLVLPEKLESDYWKGFVDVNSEKIQAMSQAGQRYDEDIISLINEGDYGAALGKTALDISEAAPMLATLIAGNAAGASNATLGLMGFNKAGEEYFRLDRETDLPEYMKIVSAVTKGANEMAFEKLGTVRILNRVRSQVQRSGADVVRNELAELYRPYLMRIMSRISGFTKDGLQESVSEMATQLADNMVTKAIENPDQDLFEGMGDAGITGAIIGQGISLPGHISGAAKSSYVRGVLKQIPDEYSSEAKLKLFNDIVKRNDLEHKAAQTENEGLRKAYKDQATAVDDSMSETIQSQEQNIPPEEVEPKIKEDGKEKVQKPDEEIDVSVEEVRPEAEVEEVGVREEEVLAQEPTGEIEVAEEVVPVEEVEKLPGTDIPRKVKRSGPVEGYATHVAISKDNAILEGALEMTPEDVQDFTFKTSANIADVSKPEIVAEIKERAMENARTQKAKDFIENWTPDGEFRADWEYNMPLQKAAMELGYDGMTQFDVTDADRPSAVNVWNLEAFEGVDLNFDQIVDRAAERSESPNELYNLFAQEGNVYDSLLPWQQDLIDNKTKFTPESIERVIGLAKKEGDVRGWYGKKGEGENLEDIASEISRDYGVEIDTDDVVEFMQNFPTIQSVQQYTPNQAKLAKRYYDIVNRKQGIMRHGKIVKQQNDEFNQFMNEIAPDYFTFEDQFNALEANKDRLTPEKYEQYKETIRAAERQSEKAQDVFRGEDGPSDVAQEGAKPEEEARPRVEPKPKKDAGEIETKVEEPSPEERAERQEGERIRVRDAEKGRKEVPKEEVIRKEIEKKTGKLEKLEENKKEALQSAAERAARLGNLSFVLDDKGRRQAIDDIVGLAYDLAKAGFIQAEIGATKLVDSVRDFLANKNPDAVKFIDLNREEIEALITDTMEPGKPKPPSENGGRPTESEFTDFPVGVTNSYTRASRMAQGKDPLLQAPRQANEALWATISNKIARGDLDPRQEVFAMNAQDQIPITDEVQAMVLFDRVRITRERNLIEADIEKARMDNDLDLESDLVKRMVELEQEADINDAVNTKIGTEWGRFGQFRQRAVSEGFSLTNILKEAKIINNDIPLTESQRRKFEELQKRYDELQQQYVVLQERMVERKQEIQEEKRVERSKDEQDKIDRLRDKARKEAAPRNVKEKSKAIADKIRKGKLKNQPFTFATVVPPQLIDGAIEVIATSIEAGGTIAHAINKGLTHIKKSDWYKNLTSRNKRDFEKAFVVKAQDDFAIQDPEENRAEFDALIAELVEKSEGTFHRGLSGVMNRIAYNQVRGGIDSVTQIVDNVYEAVKEDIPDATKRDIRDILTGYGKFRKLSKGEVETAVRELKRQGRLDSAIEDVENNRLPLRSGVERDQKTQETRSKETELVRMIKEKNLVPELTESEKEAKWKSSRDAYHQRLNNAIDDVREEIESGKLRGKKVRREYDDPESIKLRNELETLKVLRDKAFSLPKTASDAERKSAIINATKKAIEELNRDIASARSGIIPRDQELSVKREGGETIYGIKRPTPEPLQDAEIDNIRDLRDALKRELSDMLPESLKEKALLDKYRKRREKRLEQLETQLKNKDFGEKPAPEKPVLQQAERDLNRKIEEVKEQIELEKERLRLANRTKWQKGWDMAMDIWNLSKALIASVDLSAPLRQGVVFVGKPKIWGRAFMDMFGHAFSQEKHDNFLRDLKAQDVYYEMKDNGLYVAEPTARLAAKEEQYMSNFIKYFHHIPIYGNLLKGSERAYIGFLNKLRVDAYLNFRDQLEREGFTGEEMQDELKSYSRFINNSTGRGRLGPLETIAPVLNGAFFSPRLISSRLNTLNPFFYAKLSPRAQKEAFKTVLGFLGTGLMTLLMLDINDDDNVNVEWDPRSSDFAKLRVGHKRYDIWGGYQQPVRTIAQIISGQRKTTSGEVKELSKDEFPGMTRVDVLSNFFKYKLSPSASLLYGMLDDFTTAVGEDITLQKTLVEKTIPLYIMDVAELIKDEGWKGSFSAIPALFGVGVQRYGSPTQKKQRKIDSLEVDLNKKEREIKRAERQLRRDSSKTNRVRVKRLKADKRVIEAELRVVRKMPAE